MVCAIEEKKKISDFFPEYGGRIIIEYFSSSVKVELRQKKKHWNRVQNVIKINQLKLWNEILKESQNRSNKIERGESVSVSVSVRELKSVEKIENPLFRPEYSLNTIQNSFHKISQILSIFTLFVSSFHSLPLSLAHSVSISSKCLHVHVFVCACVHVCVKS